MMDSRGSRLAIDADVVELVDTPSCGGGGESRESSSLSVGTIPKVQI